MVEPPRRPGRASERIAADLEQSGARIERLRMTVAVIAVLAVLLVAAVLWLGRAFSVDPTRRAVDELAVPGWAAVSVHDETYGSRWCLGECRVRMRTWTSEGTVDDTANEYWQAVLNAGWTPADPEQCVGGLGEEGCYVRDELYLELWVVPVDCGDRYELCVGAEVTAVIAQQAALPRLAAEHSADLRLARSPRARRVGGLNLPRGLDCGPTRPVAPDVRSRKVRSTPRCSCARAPGSSAPRRPRLGGAAGRARGVLSAD
jgi:hypothetical protein